MAVYTEVSRAELDRFLAGFDLGPVRAFSAIAEGVENTNYLLGTARGRFVLTLFERRVAAADLPFFVSLMGHLAARGVACPVPVADRRGRSIHEIGSRPAVLVTFLEGAPARRLTPALCRGAGAALARLHAAAADFPRTRANDLSVAGWRAMFGRLAADAEGLRPGLARMIEGEIAALERDWPGDLPAGVVHGDMFPDNVLFRGGRVAGVIDLYFACRDLLAYDLAVCLISWCADGRGAVDPGRAEALVSGYRGERALSAAEVESLPLLARGAAVRFFLTRLEDRRDRPRGLVSRRKDPLGMVPVIEFHRSAAGRAAYGAAA